MLDYGPWFAPTAEWR